MLRERANIAHLFAIDINKRNFTTISKLSSSQLSPAGSPNWATMKAALILCMLPSTQSTTIIVKIAFLPGSAEKSYYYIVVLDGERGAKLGKGQALPTI